MFTGMVLTSVGSIFLVVFGAIGCRLLGLGFFFLRVGFLLLLFAGFVGRLVGWFGYWFVVVGLP